MTAVFDLPPWKRAAWCIPVTLAVYLVWPVPAAHPEAHPLLVVVRAYSPGVYGLWLWGGALAPGVCVFFLWQMLGASVKLWLSTLVERRTRGKLPPWPLSTDDREPAIVVGEKHHPVAIAEHPHPQWCVMPAKGLYTGLAIFGAIGTGKTSSCMYPFVRQLLDWRHADPHKRVAGLILEVKGDFCFAVRKMLKEYGRPEDYVEITTSPGGMRWNPMHAPWLDTYSLAYSLASIVNQLFGSGKDPFWQQAYTNVIRWIIQTYRVFPDPWFTFHDIYNCMVDRHALLKLVNEATQHVYGKYRYLLQLSWVDFNTHRDALLEVEMWPAGIDPDDPPDDVEPETLKLFPPEAEVTDKSQVAWADVSDRVATVVGDRQLKALRRVIQSLGINHLVTELRGPTRDELELDEKIAQWYSEGWLGLDEKLRSSIVEGMSVFLGVFVVPAVARVFCPPRPSEQTEEERKTMLPAMLECVETGRVIALNMPAGENPALARAVGVMLKGSWLGSLLLRPKAMAIESERESLAAAFGHEYPKAEFRPAVFVCDEYQSFATCGKSDPAGDEKMFALTRQSKCVPIVATQSIVSLKSVIGDGDAWRALLQTLRSRIFLSLGDDFSLETASKLLGQVTRLRANYSLSENTAQAGASLFTGRVGGGKASAGLSKSFQERREALFHPRDINLLATSQAIAQIFDGREMRDAHRVYLKPYYLDRDLGYWRQREQGML